MSIGLYAAKQCWAAEAAGVFGVPTFVYEGELFWGTDRVDLLQERLAG